jgi:hypothetical protein
MLALQNVVSLKKFRTIQTPKIYKKLFSQCLRGGIFLTMCERFWRLLTTEVKMLSKRQIKSLANRIEKAKMNIAKQRDILRDLLIEVDEIREHCDEAYDDLDRAIDGLSRLL